ERIVEDMAYHTHNLRPGKAKVAASDAKPFTGRVRIAEDSVRELFIDQTDQRRVRAVSRGEEAASLEWYADGLEVARRRRAPVGVDDGSRLDLEFHATGLLSPAERQPIHDARG